MPTPNLRTNPARRERGVVLFIALIAKVVLSLAGVALIRAVDTTGSVAGNIDWLYVSKAIVPETAIDNAHHYYGKLQAGEMPNGVPAVLSGTYAAMTGTYPFGPANIYPTTNAEIRSVIERVCSPASPAPPLTFAQRTQYCDTKPPKVSPAKTSMKLKGPTLPPIPLYRVTVRVDLPGTNASTYAQSMLQG